LLFIFLVFKRQIIARYLQRLGEGYLGSLQPSCHPKDASLPHSSRVISYSNAISNLRTLLDQLGYDGSSYSEHSSRRGVATHCSDIGVPEEDIQIARGWTNPRTLQLYIDRNPRQHQNLTKKILKL
jgi:hypothetical protein